MFLLLPLFSSAVPAASAPLPSKVENQKLPCFPEIIAQVGEACANASSVGYVVTYELNAARNVPASNPANQYPYFGTFNFLNDGWEENGNHTMFVDAWGFIRDNGIINAKDFGTIEPRSTKWVSGYQKYYNGMKNRVASIDSLSFLDTTTFTFFKKWLADHGNSSLHGGIFLVTVSAFGVQDGLIASGAEQGKWIVHTFGTRSDYGLHTLTVTGYNDSIVDDFNGDGKITTTIDINNDQIVDYADNEKGAFIIANTWGTASWDSGFCYVPYRLFLTPLSHGGTLTNRGYYITVKKEYGPQRTLRVTLDHNQRSALSLSVGISADSTATTPSAVRLLPQFNHAGGTLPMCGLDQSTTIELGLDVSDLADSVQTNGTALYFLVIDADDSAGRCDSLSLIDYTTASPSEIPSTETPLSITRGRNIFRIKVPATGVVTMHQAHAPQSPLLFHMINGRPSLLLPPGKQHLQMFSIDGCILFSQWVSGNGTWFTLPKTSGQGTFMFRILDIYGNRLSGYFILTR